MTMFGKDDDPFKGGKEEKGPAFAGGHYSALVIDNLTPERYNVCNVSEGMCRQCET